MKQSVHFMRPVTLDPWRFQAGQDYIFTVRTHRQTQWLYFRQRRLMSLSYFTNICIDQGHARWVPDQAQVA